MEFDIVDYIRVDINAINLCAEFGWTHQCASWVYF